MFTTPTESMNNPDAIDEARNAGMEIISISEKLRDKIKGSEDIEGNVIRDLSEFNREYRESFEYSFVNIDDLSDHEKWIFDKKDTIFEIIGGKPHSISDVKISETIRKNLTGFSDADGTYRGEDRMIIIRRDQLEKLQDFTGTLLHEIAHATSGMGDVTREFELELSRLMGIVGEKLIKLM